MKISTDVEHAVEFLTWLFGGVPEGFIYILRQRPASDPAEARQGKSELKPVVFSQPEKIDNSFWHEQGHQWSMTFCTATVGDKEHRNQKSNTISIPAMWVDIDGCKTLGIPGEEFFRELRDTEKVSCWTRSSANGIQGFFKLDEPFAVNGDVGLFEEEIEPLLWDIMMYYGGDERVVRLGNLMRLPGSLNVKPEYDVHYMAQAWMHPDNNYTLDELRQRFTPDPDIVPRLVGYAITRALVDVYEGGSRHDLHVLLAGTIRKDGINKEACKNLCREVCDWFGDEEINDRLTAVETTYEKPFDEIATLYSDYKEAHEEIDSATEYWVKLKKVYCKKRGYDFVPEDYDPTKPPAPDGVFWEEDFQTKFIGRSGEPEVFCNFTIELKGKVVKADENHHTCWLALIKKRGDQPTLVEIAAERMSSWRNFNTAVPVGLSLLAPTMWAQYIDWLDSRCPDRTVLESSRYGILDAEKGKPTILLPGVPHENYVWTGGEDTAEPGLLSRRISREEAVEYLEEFAEYYPTYHEPWFIWPALHWFVACPISGIIRQKIQGFPTLMVCGLTGSGKTQLFEQILVPHFGSQKLHSYKSTTIFALRTRLVSNNVCPLVMDEFRTTPGRTKEDKKAVELEDIIRNLHDGHQTAMGTPSGKLIKRMLCAPLCLIGEHHYTDEATMQRTYTIRLDRGWVNRYKKLPKEDRERLAEAQRWLYSYEHRGKLGQIIMGWVADHLDETPQVVDDACATVDGTTPIRIERKVKGFIANAAGHHLLKRIYESYGIEYPLSTKAMLDALYSADTYLMDSMSYDTETLRTLFEATDFAVINAVQHNHPVEGYVFTRDPEDENIVYFDVGRWCRHLSEYAGNLISSAAALTDKTAFRELLRDHYGEDDSPILGFPKDHPYFTRSCVKIDLGIVRKRFGINTEQWKGIDRFNDV